MPTPFNPTALLGLPLMANLATVTPEGAPRDAPMWFIWQDEAVWLPG